MPLLDWLSRDEDLHRAALAPYRLREGGFRPSTRVRARDAAYALLNARPRPLRSNITRMSKWPPRSVINPPAWVRAPVVYRRFDLAKKRRNHALRDLSSTD